MNRDFNSVMMDRNLHSNQIDISDFAVPDRSHGLHTRKYSADEIKLAEV
jgi:hypothetical protein